MLPFGFDLLARYYEGMKVESEIQNSIMLRYFYYQVVNVYVTVACAGIEITQQISEILQDPRVLIEIMGKRVPAVSLFFCNLIILKIFTALPLEMLRPPVRKIFTALPLEMLRPPVRKIFTALPLEMLRPPVRKIFTALPLEMLRPPVRKIFTALPLEMLRPPVRKAVNRRTNE